MLIVALTGGIATGKSVVSTILSQKGCYVQNADQVAHQLLEPGSEIFEELVNHFGPVILNETGKVNRRNLAEIIFKNPEERAYLNRLTHPLVLEKIKRTIKELEKEGNYEIYITEAALVIEAGYYQFYDRIILTYCSTEIQIQRLAFRDNLSREQALERILAQLPDSEKIPYAHYLIDTSGSLSETVEQTEKVFLNLYQDAWLKKSGRL
jgi:dephospho-CoA kinase